MASPGSSPIASRRMNTSGHSLTVVRGLKDGDPQSAYRRDVCQFFDDRLSAAQKLAFIHDLLHRDMAEARMFLDKIDSYSASLTDADRSSADVTQALDKI